MPLATVVLDFTSLKEQLRAIATVDTVPVMQAASQMLATAVDDRWVSGGDGEWPPHAPATVARMGPHELLIFTGVAIGSVGTDWGPDYAEAFSPTDYLKYHLEGPKGGVGGFLRSVKRRIFGGRRPTPKRNPFELTDEALDPIRDFIVEEFARQMA